MSTSIQRLVSFVRSDCGWPIASQAEGADLSERSLAAWEQGTRRPYSDSARAYISWVQREDELETWIFNPFASGEPWCLGSYDAVTLIDERWRVFAILSAESSRWCLVYSLCGQLHDVDTGGWYRPLSNRQLLQMLKSRVIQYTNLHAPWRQEAAQ